MAVVVSTLLSASPADATIVYSAVLDRPYAVSVSGSAYYGLTPTGTNPALIGDFGADKRLEVTFSAPTGMRFQILAPPPGAQYLRFAADVWSTGGVSGPVDSAGDSITFTGAVGTLPTLLGHSITTGSGPEEFRAGAGWSLSDVFEFESVTMTFGVPAAFNFNFAAGYVPGVVRLQAEARFDGSSAPSTAQFLNLVPASSAVPEPASLALVGIALAAAGLARRRL